MQLKPRTTFDEVGESDPSVENVVVSSKLSFKRAKLCESSSGLDAMECGRIMCSFAP